MATACESHSRLPKKLKKKIIGIRTKVKVRQGREGLLRSPSLFL